MTDHISDIKGWFELAVPKPTDKNRAVQLGCHWEEIGEMLESTAEFSSCLRDDIADISTAYKQRMQVAQSDVDLLELLDALCDQIVTAIGVAHMFGMDIEGALTEVTRSNYSKFVNGKPVFDVNGKIAKPPSYSKPNLEQFT